MSYFSFTCITPLDISVPNTFIVFSPAAPGEMVAGKEPELTLHIEYDYSKRCTEPLRQRGSFLGACQPNIRLPSIGKPGVRFWILQSNAKFVFVLRVDFNLEIQIRISWISSLPFDWEIRKRICKTVLVKRGLFSLIMRARARPLFLRTVSFKSLFAFPNRTVNRKSKIRFLSVEIRFWIWCFIANPKSGF